MESVYIETSYFSYLVSQPSRDLIVASHQQITQQWRKSRRSEFECVISEIVLEEAAQGDPAEVAKRRYALADMPLLEFTGQAEELLSKIMASGALPSKAVRDAAHIAVAAVHSVDYLLTWNCKHLANAQIIRMINRVCADSGFRPPVICTPEELLGEAE